MRGVTAACLCLVAIFAIVGADVDSHHLSKRQIYRHHTSKIKNTGPGERQPIKGFQADASAELPVPVAPARRPAGRPRGSLRPRPAPAPVVYEEPALPAAPLGYFEEQQYQQPYRQPAVQLPYQEEGPKSILINTQPARQSSGYKPKPAYEEYQGIPVREGYSQEQEGAYSSGNEIRGEPGKDYPIFNSPPYTKFDCSSVPTRPGMYADVETGCQVYRICDDGRHGPAGAAFLCTNGTIFNQAQFTCDWWFNVDCRQAPEYYKLNEDPAQNPFLKNDYEKALKERYDDKQRPQASAYDAKNAYYYEQ